MASNKIPERFDLIVEHLEDAADGAQAHGAAINLKQNDEAALRAILEELVGKPAGPGNVPPAVPGLKDKWNTAKAAKVNGTAAFRTAKSNGRALARACIGVLKPRLGDQWNNNWQNAGFTNHSLGVPDNPLATLQQLRSYFAANPTYEVPNLTPTISATADACEAAAQAISDAATASNQSNVDAGQAKQDLEDGITRGRARLSGLREELDQLIDDDDDLWYAFGFDKPSDPETPEVPENVIITAGGAGMVHIDWDDARRAENYRVTITDNATPANQIATQIVEESEHTFAGLPSGTAIKVTVTARNKAGGESGPSAEASGTVP
jgi:hypothetical protein